MQGREAYPGEVDDEDLSDRLDKLLDCHFLAGLVRDKL